MVNLFTRVSITSSSNVVCGALRRRELAVVAVTYVSLTRTGSTRMGCTSIMRSFLLILITRR